MKIKAFYFIFFFLPLPLFATTTCPLANGINVLTTKHVLNICKQGAIVKTFKVALGYKGVGKKQAGDNKTPIGLYGLAHPRNSNQFKVRTYEKLTTTDGLHSSLIRYFFIKFFLI